MVPSPYQLGDSSSVDSDEGLPQATRRWRLKVLSSLLDPPLGILAEPPQQSGRNSDTHVSRSVSLEEPKRAPTSHVFNASTSLTQPRGSQPDFHEAAVRHSGSPDISCLNGWRKRGQNHGVKTRGSRRDTCHVAERCEGSKPHKGSKPGTSTGGRRDPLSRSLSSMSPFSRSRVLQEQRCSEGILKAPMASEHSGHVSCALSLLRMGRRQAGQADRSTVDMPWNQRRKGQADPPIGTGVTLHASVQRTREKTVLPRSFTVTAASAKSDRAYVRRLAGLRQSSYLRMPGAPAHMVGGRIRGASRSHEEGEEEAAHEFSRRLHGGSLHKGSVSLRVVQGASLSRGSTESLVSAWLADSCPGESPDSIHMPIVVAHVTDDVSIPSHGLLGPEIQGSCSQRKAVSSLETKCARELKSDFQPRNCRAAVEGAGLGDLLGNLQMQKAALYNEMEVLLEIQKTVEDMRRKL